MKILHLDDHQLFSEGLAFIFKNRHKDITMVSALTAEVALELIQKHHDIDLIMVDLGLPGLDGVSFIHALEERQVVIPIAVLSASEDIWQIKQALDAGAVGFIPKSYDTESIFDAIIQITQGEIYIPNEIQQSLSQLPLHEPEKQQQKILSAYHLTKRQVQVLEFMQQGYSNEQIANVLNVSKNTIKTHIKNLFVAFNVNNRIECVRYGEQIGLLA